MLLTAQAIKYTLYSSFYMMFGGISKDLVIVSLVCEKGFLNDYE